MRISQLIAALMLGLSFAAASGRASAQDASESRAARLFDEAQLRIAVGDFVAACSKLAESQRLDPQLGTLLHYGHCLEKQGKLASARSAFLSAAKLAAERNATGQREPREEVARRRAGRLEPLVSTLEIQALDRTLILECDGRRLEHDEWNWPIPTDPGLHSVTASAAGYQTWTHVVEVEANAARSVVRVPNLVRLSEVRASDASRAPSPTVSGGGLGLDLSARDAADPGSRQRLVAYALGGGSVVAFGFGLVLGLNANSLLSEREEICPNASCALRFQDAERVDRLTGDARRNATRANVAFVLGAGLAGAAAVVFLTAPRQRASRPRVSFTAGPGLALQLEL